MTWSTQDALQLIAHDISSLGFSCRVSKSSLVATNEVNSDLVLVLEFKRQYRSIYDDIECYIDFQPKHQTELICTLLEKKKSRNREVFCYFTTAWGLAMALKITKTKLPSVYRRSINPWNMRKSRSAELSAQAITAFVRDEVIPFGANWNSVEWVAKGGHSKVCPIVLPFSFQCGHWAVLNFTALAVVQRFREATRVIEAAEHIGPHFGGTAGVKCTLPNDWLVFKRNAQRLLDDNL